MTKEDVYQIALDMSTEEREKFKSFLITLLESENTVISESGRS